MMSEKVRDDAQAVVEGDSLVAAAEVAIGAALVVTERDDSALRLDGKREQ